MKRAFKQVVSVLCATALLCLTALIGTPPVFAADTYNDFTYSIENGEVTITGYTGSATSLVVPAEIEGYPVTTIGREAFTFLQIKNIVIPDGVTTIGLGAFFWCEWLQHITLPDSVTVIEGYAFENCCSLQSFPLPANLTIIGEYAFSACSSFESVSIPAGVTSIGLSAFRYCDKLTDVYYGGTKKQWKAISIGVDNAPLYSAHLHLNTLRDHWERLSVLTPSNCEHDGEALFVCDCGYETTRPLARGHRFIANVCVGCGKAVDQCIASAHKYTVNTYDTWIIHQADALRVSITFSEQTYVEEDYDFIYLYDGNDTLIGMYTGNALAGKTITVDSETIKIRLTSDDSMNCYGFTVTDVKATMRGDINDDGNVTTADARAILLAVVNEVALPQTADVNRDGTVTVLDVRSLLMNLVENA